MQYIVHTYNIDFTVKLITLYLFMRAPLKP